MAAPDYGYQPTGTRLRNTEFSYPVVIGTIAFALGRKVRRMMMGAAAAFAAARAGAECCNGVGLGTR